MRFPLLFACLLPLGCGISAERAAFADEEERVTAKKDDPLPSDLRTRKTGDDWPGFLGANADSVSAEKGILTDWGKHGPPIVWMKTLGIGYSMPVVSRGRLYLFDRIRNRQRLRAMKAETGEELWKFDYATDYRDQYGYNNGPRCCPVVDGDRVYVFGPEGMLHCVRASDGKLVWKSDTKSEFGVIPNFFGVGSTPVVEGELLIAQIGGSPAGSDNVAFADLKGNGTGVVAFDKYTGKVTWKASDELASYAGPVVRTVGKRRLCFVFARGGLVALEAETGKRDFHYPWRSSIDESANASNPVVVANRVLISECYEIGSALLELKPTGGYKEVWTDRNKGRNKSLMAHWMTPVHVDGYVYGCSGRHTENAELRCLELATGKVMWREKDLTRCSLLAVDGHFVCLGEDGKLRLLKINPKQYQEVACVELRPKNKDGKVDTEALPLLEYPCWAAPILSNGLMYVRGKDRLVCLELIPRKK